MTWREQLCASRPSANDFKLLDYLYETPIVTLSQVQKLLQVNSYNTAKRSIELLIAPNQQLKLDDVGAVVNPFEGSQRKAVSACTSDRCRRSAAATVPAASPSPRRQSWKELRVVR
jgi:hypothetical protein